MSLHTPLQAVGDPAATMAAANLLAYASIAVAAAVLFGYLVGYVQYVLAADTVEWWYIAVAAGAAVIYGVSGAASMLADASWLTVFTDGAVLFFILFLALGLRALYHAEGSPDGRSRLIPVWVDYLVVAAFVAAWWLGFLVEADWTRLVVAAGWLLASAWAVLYGVLTVRFHEGTTLAAITRHLLPAALCVVAIVVVDLGGSVVGLSAAYVDAIWLVGTVLAAAFLFNTAVAIRQEGGQLQRMYDWTTWRQQSLEE
ncbi:hypothetical protein HWV23_10315 [Natronomonas halophila]|uniref:hypothetical protein n=1 Tax=Natronomonas halophila TaxID=2747817 RepID=UPI0015B5A443|nr:hypothetical protein [Natronomonas halophila]QLD86104.1 hypothetical protein HWV23_10315 [Natronomonas halophila]